MRRDPEWQGTRFLPEDVGVRAPGGAPSDHEFERQNARLLSAAVRVQVPCDPPEIAVSFNR